MRCAGVKHGHNRMLLLGAMPLAVNPIAPERPRKGVGRGARVVGGGEGQGRGVEPEERGVERARDGSERHAQTGTGNLARKNILSKNSPKII